MICHSQFPRRRRGRGRGRRRVAGGPSCAAAGRRMSGTVEGQQYILPYSGGLVRSQVPPPHIGAYRRWVSMHSGVERLFWPINYCGEL